METSALQKYTEYSAITDYSDRQRVARLESRFIEIEGAASGGKVEMMRLVAEQEGMPFRTFRNKYYAWLKGGAGAIADRRRMARAMSGDELYDAFKTYAERDVNTSRGGYEAMLRDLRAGKTFAFGTWRDLWKRQYPFEAVPAFCPPSWVPRGFTYANMMEKQSRDASRAMALAWNRQGQFAALRHTLPVLRSRAGLPVGAVYQADDVWHNIDVFQPGLKGVFNPLEFAIYDVSSAYKAVSVMKPRVLVVDPKTGKETRDNLKEMQFRFAMAYLVTQVGYHRDGVTFILERGTTAIRENVQRRVAAIPGYGRKFAFQVSGVKNTPAHKGMFIGNAGGNPRMKSLCECAHNIMHNATASLPGSHGRDAAHLHESNAALVKYSAEMVAQAEALDPALVPMLQLPILDYRHYQQYFYAIEAEVMDRHEHRLEGWGEREVLCYRMDETSQWRPASELADMPPEKAAAVAAYLGGRRELMCMRRMSRREAWRAGQGELERLPLIEMPAFLDPRDMREGRVRDDGTIVFEDAVYYPGERKIYNAVVTDRAGFARRLAPGETVKFYWNPLGDLAKHIWLADDEGNVVGMCPALQTARWNDRRSIEAAMGQQAAQIAAAMSDTRARQAESEIVRRAAQNVNRALIEAAKEAASRGPAPTGDGFTLDELNGASDSSDVQALPEQCPNADALAFLDELNHV